MKFTSDCSYRLGERVLHKEDIKEFLSYLQRTMHGYYAFLARAPLRNFCITIEDAFFRFSERLSIDDFLASYPRYHPRLAICSIQYRIYRFRKDWDTQAPGWRDYLPTYDGVELGGCLERTEWLTLYRDLPRMLAHALREDLRNNRPFKLTPDAIETYGFTAQDITQLEPLIAECHAELRAELRADYERLASLDFIREER